MSRGCLCCIERKLDDLEDRVNDIQNSMNILSNLLTSMDAKLDQLLAALPKPVVGIDVKPGTPVTR